MTKKRILIDIDIKTLKYINQMKKENRLSSRGAVIEIIVEDRKKQTKITEG